ncbi:MAG TPA: hypothetical protein VHZ81_08925 [Galbitalea sp.]|nr:hypothetical protein [Galbitalea sp.]
MLTAVTYADQWSNFFILVGTGSATLAGLVFVALTINLRGVAQDATHKFRAINMLSGFTAVFLTSALALMGTQTYLALGLEWLVVSVLAAAINTNGYIQGYRTHSSRYALSPFRIAGGSLCYLGQIVGSTMLLLGIPGGLYVAAISLIVNFVFFVSGAWLLILGTLQPGDK